MTLLFEGKGAWTKSGLKGFFLAILLTAAFAFPATAKPEILPVALDEYGRITVPTLLDGRSEAQYFLFDSAARRSLLLNRDSDANGIRRYEKGTIRHYSAEGLLRLPAATISSWKVGSRTVKNSIIGLYSDTDEAAGLVGNNVFLGRILHWRPGAGQLEIHANTAPFAGASWRNVGGRPNRHFSMLLTTEYRGVEITVLVATGASRTVLDTGTLNQLFPNSKQWSEKNIDYKSVEFGLGSQRKNFRDFTLPNFAIGKWHLGDIGVLSKSFDTKEITGFVNAPVMILGADILLANEVAFDFRDYQLWVKD